MDSFGERLKKLRSKQGLNQAKLAKLLGTGQASVSDWENGKSHPRPSQRERLAEILQTSMIALEFGQDGNSFNDNSNEIGSTQKKTPLVGAIGAGGEIHPFDDHAKGAGLDYVDTPPGAPKGTLAARVSGTSMYPFLKEGALIYFSERQLNVIDYLHEMVICHFTDGRKAVKILTPGTEPGRFTLTSVNAEPMLNQEIESISPIDWMKP